MRVFYFEISSRTHQAAPRVRRTFYLIYPRRGLMRMSDFKNTISMFAFDKRKKSVTKFWADEDQTACEKNPEGIEDGDLNNRVNIWRWRALRAAEDPLCWVLNRLRGCWVIVDRNFWLCGHDFSLPFRVLLSSEVPSANGPLQSPCYCNPPLFVNHFPRGLGFFTSCGFANTRRVPKICEPPPSPRRQPQRKVCDLNARPQRSPTPLNCENVKGV